MLWVSGGLQHGEDMTSSNSPNNCNTMSNNKAMLDGNPEPDLVHATGCKQPTLRT
jgi:hypothetical protein